MTNYAALGEYTAYSRQAKDAAMRRYALMQNLSLQIKKFSEDSEQRIAVDCFKCEMEEIDKADSEMRAALDRANQAAALCGENKLTVRMLNAK